MNIALLLKDRHHFACNNQEKAKKMEIVESFDNQTPLLGFLELEPLSMEQDEKEAPQILFQGKGRGKISRKKRRFNKSLWTLQQNLNYMRFLEENRQLFESPKENRRTLKVNKLLSLHIKTRSPDQCRSHHQKMIKYHQSIEGILRHVGLLQNKFYESPCNLGEERVAMRIRKKTSKGETEETPSTPNKEDSLWDVLWQEEANICENLHYE